MCRAPTHRSGLDALGTPANIPIIASGAEIQPLTVPETACLLAQTHHDDGEPRIQNKQNKAPGPVSPAPRPAEANGSQSLASASCGCTVMTNLNAGDPRLWGLLQPLTGVHWLWV